MAKQVEMTESQMDAVTRNTKELLNEMPKVTVKIHLPQEQAAKINLAKENGKPYEVPFTPVSINGYIYQINHGEKVEVPEEVANILENAGLI